MQVGKHLLTQWSSTQSTVALSSAEAELNAFVKGASEGLGVSHLYQEFGHTMSLCLSTDSSAARGIVMRRGPGKVKHLRVRQLWVQELFGARHLKRCKIPRSLNSAGPFTHHWLANEGRIVFTRLRLLPTCALAQAEGGCERYPPRQPD